MKRPRPFEIERNPYTHVQPMQVSTPMASMMDDEENDYTNLVRNTQQASNQHNELNCNPEPLQMESAKPSSKCCRRPSHRDWALIIGLVIVVTLVVVLVVFMTYQFNLRGLNTEAPRVKGSCPLYDGLWEEFKGSYYYFETAKTMTWDEAGRDCSTKGASLVSIHSKEENDFVYRKLIQRNSNITSAWTGLFQSGMKWKWSDFSPMDFTIWAPGEPNNYKNLMEDCMEFWVDDHFQNMWNDEACTATHNYVCKAPNSNQNY